MIQLNNRTQVGREPYSAFLCRRVPRYRGTLAPILSFFGSTLLQGEPLSGAPGPRHAKGVAALRRRRRGRTLPLLVADPASVTEVGDRRSEEPDGCSGSRFALPTQALRADDSWGVPSLRGHVDCIPCPLSHHCLRGERRLWRERFKLERFAFRSLSMCVWVHVCVHGVRKVCACVLCACKVRVCVCVLCVVSFGGKRHARARMAVCVCVCRRVVVQ